MSNALLIIPCYLRSQADATVLMKCIGSIRQTQVKEDIFLIDDGSPWKEKEKVYEEAKEWHDNVEFYLKDENGGFSETVNIGLGKALSEERDACLINADIEFTEIGWLQAAQRTKADIIGALLLYPNDLIQHAGIYFSHITRSFDHRFKGSPSNLPAAQKECKCPVTAALQYIRHDVLKDVGLYDEEFKMSYEDVDFMIRAIEKGYTSVYNPKVKAVHHESLFRGGAEGKLKDWQKDSYARLLMKYKDHNFADIAPILWDE